MIKKYPGCLIEVTTSETIERIPDIGTDVLRQIVREIADSMNISIERMQNILTSRLDARKLNKQLT